MACARTDRAITSLAPRPLSSACVMGVLIGIFLTIGRSFAQTGSFDGMLSSPLCSIAVFLTSAVVSSLVLSAAFRGLDLCASKPFSECGRLRPAVLGRHPFVVSAIVLALCWAPYLVVFFPGSLPYDGVRSLNQFLTDAPLENHHPVLMNMLYALLYSAGSGVAGLLGTGAESAFSPDNLGIFSIVLFQTVCCVLAFAAVVGFLAKMRAPSPLVWLTLAFFALFPLWGSFAQAAMKDGFYNAVLAVFVLACAQVLIPAVRDRDEPTLGMWVALFFSALLACLARNNGVYLAVPTLIAVALLVREKRAVIAALATAICYVAITGALWPAIGVDMSTTQKEMLSVPFQQTARYVSTYPDDVTEEERAAIEGVLPYDELPSLYCPDLSDPVKESYKLYNAKVEGSEEYTEEHPDALKEYLKAWVSMGLRHPGCYLQATVANTYAYFYPGVIVGPEINRSIFSFYMQTGAINETFHPHYVVSEDVRLAFQNLVEGGQETPVLKRFWSPAVYVWILLAGWCYALHRKKSGLVGAVLLIPATILLLTTLAGPLNGHLRYVMPIIATLPVAYAAFIRFPHVCANLGRHARGSGEWNAFGSSAKER